MANKKRTNDLKTSLDAIRQINWFDGIHKLPNSVNKKLLDQCSDIIKEFIENDESFPTKTTKSNPRPQKRQVSKPKKPKIKVAKTKQTKLNQISHKIKSVKKQTPHFNYANTSSTNGYPCYPSAFPCFRSCGPINCPKNKLPMPRDLWYRIVYSQALEQQLGSGEAFLSQNRSVSRLPSSSKRKHKEDESSTNNLHKNKSNSTNSRRQKTMNATFSSTSTKTIKPDVNDHLRKSGMEGYLTNGLIENPSKEWNHEASQSKPSDAYKPFSIDNLEYIAETLPLQIENEHNQPSKCVVEASLWNTKNDVTVSCTQSAHAELIHRPQIHRGISADATLERIIPLPSAPSASIVLNNQSKFEEITTLSIQQSTKELAKTSSSFIAEHPLINQLFEYYNLQEIPRPQLFKRLNRRLMHIRQTLKMMPSNDMEIKLKYKRDALVKKRQMPVQSMTKDERIAMAELELNVYEYVKALDEPSFRMENNIELESEQLMPAPMDTVLPLVKSAMASEISIAPSVSTFNTVQPSAISQSTALLSTTTQFSEKTDKFIAWNHPLLPNLMNMFGQLTPLRKAQIHKQLARRCKHISRKAKELDRIQLQTQIDSKSKALEKNKNIFQPNEDEHLRIAELEICLFELEKEQTQRSQID